MRFHPGAAPTFWTPGKLAVGFALFGGGYLLEGGPDHLLGATIALAIALALAGAAVVRRRAAPPQRLQGRCRHCGEPLPVAGAAPERCPACDEPAPLYRPDAPTSRRPRLSGRGFTLIEVLMTVAITALVFAMIGGILLSVIKASENIETKTRTEKAGYGVLATLRRDLTGVYAYALGGPAFRGEDKTELGRDADALHFVTTADVLPTQDGRRPRLIEVGYRVGGGDESQDGLLGLFRRAGALEGDPLESGDEYAELYGRVHAFDLKYLDPDTGDWADSWDDAERLPLAVKVHLELALDELQKIAAEQENLDLPPPVFEMVVGIPVKATPAEDTGSGQPGEAGGAPTGQ